MAQITITEALAELKTLDKRIAKKREFVLNYLIRQEMFRDPLEKDGGSPHVLARELQAIRDLEDRKVLLRRAIQQANDRATVTVGRQTRSIADWLVWRRDVVPHLSQFLANVRNRIDQARREATTKGAALAGSPEAARPQDVIVNLNEHDLAKQIEALEEVMGALDGQLSLKNATLLIDA